MEKDCINVDIKYVINELQREGRAASTVKDALGRLNVSGICLHDVLTGLRIGEIGALKWEDHKIAKDYGTCILFDNDRYLYTCCRG